MSEFLAEYYLWIRALHVISLISWMAGLLYLPRIYVYHTRVEAESEASEIFKTMERKLLRFIMNPAMIATFLFGILLVMVPGVVDMKSGWFHLKLLLVLMMAGMHGMMAKFRKDFEQDDNRKSEKFYRIFNEVPAVLMVIIVILAVVKPF